MIIATGDESVTAVNAAAGMNKLLQISGGAVYTDEHETIKFDVSPRLNALLEVLDDTDHKILLFVPYKHTIEFLAEFLTSKKNYKFSYQWCCLCKRKSKHHKQVSNSG